MLEGWLDYHRDTLLHKCAGLTAEQLRTPSVEPSDLTLLGLVRHMTEVERSWFRQRVAGEDLPDLYCTDATRTPTSTTWPTPTPRPTSPPSAPRSSAARGGRRRRSLDDDVHATRSDGTARSACAGSTCT